MGSFLSCQPFSVAVTLECCQQASEGAHTKESHSSEKSSIHRGVDRHAGFRGIICGYHMCQSILCVHLLYQQALNLEALLLLNEHTCTYTRYTHTHTHICRQHTWYINVDRPDSHMMHLGIHVHNSCTHMANMHTHVQIHAQCTYTQTQGTHAHDPHMHTHKMHMHTFTQHKYTHV